MKNYPLKETFARYHQGPENFQTNELSGVSNIPKKYPTITVRLIAYVYVQNFHPVSSYTTTLKHGPSRLL